MDISLILFSEKIKSVLKKFHEKVSGRAVEYKKFIQGLSQRIDERRLEKVREKLKNIKYALGIKLIAVIICIMGMLLLSFGLLKGPYFENAFEKGEYLESSSNARILGNYYNYAYRTAFYYKSDENIKSGNALSDVISEYQRQLRENRNHSIASINEQYSNWIQEARNSGNDTETTRLTNERDILINDEQLSMEKELEEIKQREVQNQLDEFHSLKNKLEKAEGIYYYALSPNGDVLSNIGAQTDAKAFFKGLPVFMAYGQPEGENQISSLSNYNLPDGSVLYTGMSKDRFLREQQTYTDNKAVGLWGIYEATAGLIIFLMGLCYLLYAAGKRSGMEGVHLLTIDRLYLDVGCVIIVTIEAVCINLLYELWRSTYTADSGLFYTLGSLLVVSGTALALVYLTMAAKRFKRREFLRSNLLYAIPASILRYVKKHVFQLKSLIHAGSANARTTWMFIAYAAAVALSIIITVGLATSEGGLGVLFGLLMLIGVNVVALTSVLKKVQALKEIASGVQRIRTGDFSRPIVQAGGEEMSSLAENINHVADGLKVAVESEVKAERMKAELVTNVSHDLKTPLTSIITYIDLLKKEGFQSENAAKYLGILEQKSNRLKTLTEDLFEAAKAASGSIAVTLEELDAGALLMQGMGELSDKINESGLEFKINIPDEKLMVKADGRLLWRVVENLLSNVFKYAQKGSRVYIDIACTGSQVQIIIKNISAFELNISPDELTERFKRGDQSRNSEGSGLGLSIAKSLTELQGGTFHIDIDGDLFKATVTLSS